MKRFIIMLSIFTALVALIFFSLLRQADGYTDPYYLRFTTKSQQSLIVGTSKAAQGLQPHIMNDILKANLYNYSFTVSASPFGKTYLNSIKRKLDKNTKSGLFIITVDPWSIASKKSVGHSEELFRENNSMLGTTPFVNLDPNPFYFINSYNDKFKSLLESKQNWFFLHDNGWLEVFAKIDSLSLSRSRQRVLDNWIDNNTDKYEFSTERYNYLKQLITYLKQFGEVYIVRLPVDPEFFKEEQLLMPRFNKLMMQLEDLSNGYLDLTNLNEKLVFHDGVHLYKTSGAEVSKYLAQWIQSKRLKN